MRLGFWQRDRVAGVDRRFHLGGAGRLDADDLHVGPGLLDGGRHASGQSAAADRHEHRRDVGPLIEDLEAGRTLAGDDPLVVERRHHGESAFRGFGLGARAAIRRRRPREDHLRAERPRPLDLDLRRRRRHDDDRRCPQRSCRERHGLAVIA